MALSWSYLTDGRWSAESEFVGLCSYTWPRGLAYYRVGICEDGTFDVSSETDEALLGDRKPDCFPSLSQAQAWCEARERGMVQEAVAAIDDDRR